MASPQTQPRLGALELLGDLHPLLAQLGAVDGLVTLQSAVASLQLPPLADRPALRAFLGHYRDRLLLPVEFPAIRQAWHHAGRREARELIALDTTLSADPRLAHWAAASRRVGGAQLQQLRPLRDERVVQRYLAAVETGAAHGWHTLVYGLTLSVYSLPLRQGLLGYAHQSLDGFLHAAGRALRLDAGEVESLFNEAAAEVPAAIDRLLQPTAA